MFTNNSILKSHSLKPWHLYSYSMPYSCVKNNRVKACKL